MHWTWDPEKDRINRRKHRISFETAQLVFQDRDILIDADQYPYEQRWRAIGYIDGMMVTVIYTEPEEAAHGKPPLLKGRYTKKYMAKLTEEQKAELRALAELPDEEIDLSDIPERDIDWSTARRGLFYRPVKQEVTLTLDECVIDWFEEKQADEKARHEAINEVLIEYILDQKFPNRDKNSPEWAWKHARERPVHE